MNQSEVPELPCFHFKAKQLTWSYLLYVSLNYSVNNISGKPRASRIDQTRYSHIPLTSQMPGWDFLEVYNTYTVASGLYYAIKSDFKR